MSEMMTSFIELFGGLGLFLYGMSVMSEGLEKAAGSKMKRFIEILTTNRFTAVIVGAFVTMIVQSSSATTVMVVGFVNAGIMNLTQAIGVIMGANIGTTITAQLVAFKLTALAPVAIGLGVGLKLFSKNPKTKKYAEILLGFGILFMGMDVMKHSMKPLRSYQGFTDLLMSFGSGRILDTVLAIFTGFSVTAIIQSSSATTGIMVALASSGMLPIDAAFPILLGTNIGTCVTAMISSIGANKTAKRAAVMHMMFNIIGTAIFAILLAKPSLWFVKQFWSSPERQLAMMHTTFNITTTLMLVGFAPLIVKLAQRMIPVSETEMRQMTGGTKYVDDRILETPSIAIVQLMKEVLHMGNVANDTLKLAGEALIEGNEDKAKEAFEKEKQVNGLEHAIMEYLVKLSNSDIAPMQRVAIDGLFSTVNDIERVADHADNIAELAIERVSQDLEFSDKAISELDSMMNDCITAFTESLNALHSYDKSSAQRVIEREGYIDLLEKNLRKKHIERLNGGRCQPSSGVLFLDAISNLERVGDHASNIALAVLDQPEVESA